MGTTGHDFKDGPLHHCLGEVLFYLKYIFIFFDMPSIFIYSSHLSLLYFYFLQFPGFKASDRINFYVITQKANSSELLKKK